MSPDSCDQMSRGNVSRMLYESIKAEYTKVEPISIKALISAQKDMSCKEFWTEICVFEAWLQVKYKSIYRLDYEWDHQTILNYLKSNPKPTQWLIDKGFIKVTDPEPVLVDVQVESGTHQGTFLIRAVSNSGDYRYIFEISKLGARKISQAHNMGIECDGGDKHIHII